MDIHITPADAASMIQKFYRSHVDRKIFRFYKSWVDFGGWAKIYQKSLLSFSLSLGLALGS